MKTKFDSPVVKKKAKKSASKRKPLRCDQSESLNLDQRGISPRSNCSPGNNSLPLREVESGTNFIDLVEFVEKKRRFTRLAIPVLRFNALVKQITKSIKPNKELIWQTESLLALQCDAEAYLVSHLKDAQLAAYHRGSHTVRVRDMALASALGRDWRSDKLDGTDPVLQAYICHNGCRCELRSYIEEDDQSD